MIPGKDRVFPNLIASFFVVTILSLAVFAAAESGHTANHPVTADVHAAKASAQTDQHAQAASHEDPEHGDGNAVLHHLEHHLCDGYEVELPGFSLHSFIPFSIGGKEMLVTKHVYFLWISGLLLILLGLTARRKYQDGVPRGGLSNALEAIIIFVRDDVVLPNAGPAAIKYLGFFITLFMFILVMNLLGMVPWGSSASGNISVTATLAGISFLMIHWSGIREHGLFRHFGNLIPHGVPVALYPILLPIEILGMFTKPFALAMRLFANMLAGHAVIATFLALIPVGLVGALTIGSLAVAGSVAISMLELFVAFLQAYIFTMLTAIFIGGALNPH